MTYDLIYNVKIATGWASRPWDYDWVDLVLPVWILTLPLLEWGFLGCQGGSRPPAHPLRSPALDWELFLLRGFGLLFIGLLVLVWSFRALNSNQGLQASDWRLFWSWVVPGLPGASVGLVSGRIVHLLLESNPKCRISAESIFPLNASAVSWYTKKCPYVSDKSHFLCEITRLNSANSFSLTIRPWWLSFSVTNFRYLQCKWKFRWLYACSQETMFGLYPLSSSCSTTEHGKILYNVLFLIYTV